jgi:hypothetical protein
VYVADGGIYSRQLQEHLVGAPGDEAPAVATALFLFQ